MRAYIEPPGPLSHLLDQEKQNYIQIKDLEKNYSRNFYCPPLPWKIQYDNEEIQIRTYDTQEIEQKWQ
jgi:hypothetical protein